MSVRSPKVQTQLRWQQLTQPLVLVLRVPGTLAGETVRVALEEAVGADGFRKLDVGRPAPSHPMEDE